jgi:cell division protein ZapA (FtsZ GTPase activity inhibitor)
MRENLVEVKLGRTKLKVPIVVDAETTHRVAEAVNERMRQIEAGSGRVDSYDFALLAAMSFASELERLLRENAETQEQADAADAADERELFVALSKINDAIKSALVDFRST